MSENQIVHVAVGVIVNASGKILLTKRAEGSHQGGLWEFPGGKVELNESVQVALARELKEELAIDVQYSEPLIKIKHNYTDKTVLLDVWLVKSFLGKAIGNEGQPLEWIGLDALSLTDDCQYPLPDANKAIVTALQLPSRQLVTGDHSSPSEFKNKLRRALMSGIRFVHLRLDLEKCSVDLANEIIKLSLETCESYDVCLVLNSRLLDVLDSELVNIFEKHNCGIHLTSEHLNMLSSLPPIKGIIGASCHNEEELSKASALNVDYVNISPVKETQSHPDSAVLGWESFSEMTHKINVPVYALGGLTQEDLSKVRESGGQGVAGISDFWV
ncbi:MAG: Nudix family hydrolase [Cellvibrionaceae bacterium]